MLPAQNLRPERQDGRLAKGPLGTEVPEGGLDTIAHMHEMEKKGL